MKVDTQCNSDYFEYIAVFYAFMHLETKAFYFQETETGKIW